MALRQIAGDRVKLTLLSPAADFVYRPIAVLEPFVGRPPRRLPLAKVAAELNATLEQDTLARVDVERRVLHTGGEREMRYDALVVAVGARSSAALPDALVIDPSHMGESLHGLIEQIDSGTLGSLAFVVSQPTWPLPVYEVALLVAERAREKKVDLDITIITAEPAPLAVFGEKVSVPLGGLLADANIQMIVGAQVESSPGGLTVRPGERQLQVDSVVAVPRLMGPAVLGLPANADGFLPVTPSCEVSGVERVYAVGDATDFPVKFGSIAAQQGDAAAASIAALAGVPTEPSPFDGVVHGALIAGQRAQNLYFTAHIEGGIARESRTSDTPTSSPAAKIAARYLGPYLDELWAAGPRWVVGQLSWEARLAELEARSGA